MISGFFNGSETYGNIGLHSLSMSLKSLENFKSLLPYFWAYHVFTHSRQTAMLAVWLLLTVSAIAGIWGTVQQVFDIHLGYKYLQGTGFLGGPMAFAGQMQLFSLLSLGLLFAGSYKQAAQTVPERFRSAIVSLQNPFVFSFIVLANFAGVLFAAERSAWLGVLFGILTVACLRSWKLMLKVLLALSALCTALWAFVPVVQIRINSLFATLSGAKDVSVQARLTIWKSCIDIFKQSPLFGTGIFRFPHFDIKEAIVPGVSVDLNHGHSNYFHMLAATGLLGLASFIYLLASILIYGSKELKANLSAQDNVRSGILIGLLGGTMAMVVSGLFEYNFGAAQVRLAQWFLLGLL
ncbi:MAG: O-antigen ligase family protein [Candidatus Obscuribacterales bacterium]|nr:O-antigen ligase family protein [Candidatus Obscuribacterales bacterium]